MYHTNSTQLLEGATNATLSWNFSLTQGLSFTSLQLKFNDESIGGVLSGQARLIEAFTERFNFIWIPNQKATLMIFSVTSNESGTYDCVVTTTSQQFETKVWTSKIQVDVVGKPCKLIILLLFIYLS